jgi:hypothetical protein
LQAAGRRVLMVGDGINDASAMAAAHVAIGLASGAELARAAAPVTLVTSDLRCIPWAVAVCRRAMGTLNANLRWAVAYNVIGMALAAAGLLHPIAAAVLMVGSSLLVAWRSAVAEGEPELAAPTNEQLELFRPAVHALSLALQGWLVANLAGATVGESVLVAGGCLAVGAWLADCWRRNPGMPHALDMSLGMLTLGSLGMALGWQFDAWRNPTCCSQCAAGGFWQHLQAMPGMWLGMLATSHMAMVCLVHRPCPAHGWWKVALALCHTLGMCAGMLVGGALATEVAREWPAMAIPLEYGGMVVGMIAGMLAVHVAWTAREEHALTPARDAGALRDTG